MSSSSPSGGQSNIDLWGSEAKFLDRVPFLANSAEMSDVKFIFNTEEGEKIVPGHKLILGLASPVFHKLFYSKSPGFTTYINENQIRMEGHLLALGPEAFEYFMKFLYMGGISSKEFFGLSIENMIGILNYADYYDVPYLKAACVFHLMCNITKENVIPILKTAIMFRVAELANQALSVIDKNAVFVFESEEILSVEATTLFEIFKRDTLDIEECYVLDLALKWAENKCKMENLELEPCSVGNMRKVLGSAFFEIRFVLLSPERISDIGQSGLLTSEEIAEMFLQHYQSGMGMPHDERIGGGVLFKSNVRFRGLKVT